jgi:hypothetical protein
MKMSIAELYDDLAELSRATMPLIDELRQRYPTHELLRCVQETSRDQYALTQEFCHRYVTEAGSEGLTPGNIPLGYLPRAYSSYLNHLRKALGKRED